MFFNLQPCAEREEEEQSQDIWALMSLNSCDCAVGRASSSGVAGAITALIPDIADVNVLISSPGVGFINPSQMTQTF